MIFLMSFTPVIIEKNRKSIVIQDYVKAGTYLKKKKKKSFPSKINKGSKHWIKKDSRYFTIKLFLLNTFLETVASK